MRVRHQRNSAVVLLFLLVSACQQTTPTTEPVGTAGATSNPGSSEGLPSGSDAPGTPTATSDELIGDALAAGTITYEESLVDRALALFASPGLPEQFRSGQPNLDDGTALFAEIEAKQSTLSAATMTTLAPFLVRPSDATSIFSAPRSASAGGGGVVLAASTTTGWISQPAADNRAVVWVQDTPGAARRLAIHAADVTKVWAAYQDVFQYPNDDAAGLPNASVNPTAAVDFYFIEASDLDPRQPDCSDPATAGCSLASERAAGYARTADARTVSTSSAYFVLDAGQGGDKALFELAHEIAHGGQFHFDNQESPWLSESTANWVAYRVFQKLGLPPDPAYGWLPPLFANPGTALTSEGDKWAYRAWLYFQFAAMERGDGIVSDIWADAGKPGAQGAQAVDDVFPFAAHFADFSVRNWNQEPVPNRYRSAPDPTFPELKPSVRKDTPALKPGPGVELDVALPHLATAYFTFGFDASARKITFDNTLAGLDGAHVWVIKEIAGIWHEPEDWSGEAKKELCRDNDAENVSKLVFVVSYAKLIGNLDAGGANPKVTASAGGCGDWKGTMKATQTWTTPDQYGKGTATFEGVWTLDPQALVTCLYDDPPCNAYLPTGTISWTWQATNLINGGIACQEDEHGSVPAGQVRDVVTQRLVLTPTSDPGKLSYWATGVFLTPTKLKCASIEAGAGVGSFTYVPEGAADAAAGPYGDTCDYTTWVIDATATSITGSCYQWNTSAHSLMFEWNLTRIGPPPA